MSRKFAVSIFLFFFVLLAYSFVTRHFSEVAASDPDRYFHLGLAKISAETPIPTILPQVEDLGWNKKFLEKNFLFTWLTGRAYRWGGETAVLLVNPFLVGLFSLGLFLLFSELASPLFAFFLLLIPLFTTDFANRISLLRPHLLGFAAYTFLAYGLFTRRKLLSFAAALIFPLGYHATYLPLALIGVWLLFSWKQGKAALTPVFSATLGLALGIILNPYFPFNILTGANSFKIATNAAGLGAEDRPIEVIPVRTDEFLTLFGIYLAFLGLCLFFRWKAEKSKATSTSPQFAVALTLSLLFWFLSCISRRAAEYAIPSTLLLMAVTYGLLPTKELKKALAFSTLALFCLISLPKGLIYYSRPLRAGITPHYALAALEVVPENEIGKKIFNCEWDNGSFIFYKRPNHRFVDLSDALLLYNQSPLLHHLRAKLRTGDVANPYGLLKETFHADYVLCSHPTIISQLEKDPFFTRLYPKVIPHPRERVAGLTFLYALNPSPTDRFVSHFEIAALPPVSRPTELLQPEKLDWNLFQLPNSLSGSLYLDVFSWLSQNQPEMGLVPNDQFLCASLRPTVSELERFRGKNQVTLGGGEHLWLWWNKKLLLEKHVDIGKPRLIHTTLPLPRALQVGDEIQSVLCSARDGAYMGLSMAFDSYNVN